MIYSFTIFHLLGPFNCLWYGILFPAKNQTLRPHRVYIPPTRWASSAHTTFQSKRKYFAVFEMKGLVHGICKSLIFASYYTRIPQLSKNVGLPVVEEMYESKLGTFPYTQEVLA